jgi:hypothetical protein
MNGMLFINANSQNWIETGRKCNLSIENGELTEVIIGVANYRHLEACNFKVWIRKNIYDNIMKKLYKVDNMAAYGSRLSILDENNKKVEPIIENYIY